VNRKSISPLILAAGASTRMGRHKALLVVGGLPALGRAIAVCRAAGLGRPVVVLGALAEAIRPAARGARVVVNRRWARGQTSSLKAGLRALPSSARAFLLYPVDFPLITPAVVRSLVAARERTGKAIVIPSHAMRRGHPVLFDAALRREFLALGDGEPARRVVDAEPRRIAYVAAPAAVLRDMDTPGDYEEVRRQEVRSQKGMRRHRGRLAAAGRRPGRRHA
jgi:molybdenum cofactor cytidylyltransferase